MMRPTPKGASDHRGPMRHDPLTPTHHDDDRDGWMIGYLDVMTLLVALLVLIFTLSFSNDDEAAGDAGLAVDPPGPMSVPLPPELARALAAMPAPLSQRPGWLDASAVTTALGVAGLPVRHVEHQVPPLLAPPTPASRESPFSPPTPLALLAEPAPRARLPQPLEPADSQPASPYLPDLEGVAVSRVTEGIKLRVEDQWLFPTAKAELTGEGLALVQRMVAIIQRHAGEVAVEGHTDSRTIQTDDFPSNWVLSSARAIAIVHALEDAGVASHRLRAVGLADTRPLTSNDTAEGRARNRRVEVIIDAR